ncbi:MAG TPA: DNA topoisomerase IB [Caulobacteraceae bacterium]|nr:DNA topoisomerase IB [Caulobacteraceae bacterium]
MPLDVSPKSIAPTAPCADIPLGDLVYVTPEAPGLSRIRRGETFAYVDADGRAVRDAVVLERIKALAIPPAWSAVWICADPNGHLQAVGQDEKGRRQYRYHPDFRALREEAKFHRLASFAESLPALRAAITQDMAERGLSQRKVLAVVARLLETTLIRVGNRAYAKQNRSYGLTTLLSRHVRVEHADLKFQFKGKSGKQWRLQVHDRRIARIVKSCQELPGQHLFQYRDAEGRGQAVTSAAVNAYLKAVSGADITAKDFRTWTGTVMAALALAELGPPASATQAKRNLSAAIAQTAARLGNTPAICRKCYVHPEVIAAYLEGALTLGDLPDADEASRDWTGLHPEEAQVLAFLKARGV